MSPSSTFLGRAALDRAGAHPNHAGRAGVKPYRDCSLRIDKISRSFEGKERGEFFVDRLSLDRFTEIVRESADAEIRF